MKDNKATLKLEGELFAAGNKRLAMDRNGQYLSLRSLEQFLRELACIDFVHSQQGHAISAKHFYYVISVLHNFVGAP